MMILLCAAGVLLCLCLAVSFHDTRHFTVTRYSIVLPKLKKPQSICVLSDLHDHEYGRDNEKLISAVAGQKPDLIVIAGDLLTAHRDEAHLQPDIAVNLVKELAKTAPVYIGEGNHEHRIRTWYWEYGDFYKRYVKRLKAAGAKHLREGDVILEDAGLHIRGLDADEIFFRKFVKTPMTREYLDRELSSPDPERADILVAHHPWFFPEYAGWGDCLVLSGHFHGGIVRLPFIGGVISPAFRLFPKYDSGVHTLGGSSMVVSRGLGTHTIRFRCFNPGELVVIDLMPQAENR